MAALAAGPQAPSDSVSHTFITRSRTGGHSPSPALLPGPAGTHFLPSSQSPHARSKASPLAALKGRNIDDVTWDTAFPEIPTLFHCRRLAPAFSPVRFVVYLLLKYPKRGAASLQWGCSGGREAGRQVGIHGLCSEAVAAPPRWAQTQLGLQE